MNARVEPLSADHPRWSGELSAYVVDDEPIILFAALTGSERALSDLRSATTACLTSPLTIRFREILILRICAVTGCRTEWELHVKLFAKQAELTVEDLDALRSGRGPAMQASDRLAIELADAVVAGPRLPEPLWRRLADQLGPELTLDSLMVAGQYLKVVWLANALGLNP